MLAEMKDPQIPYLDKDSNNVYWKGRVFPFAAFYFINETTTLLLNILERNALKFQMPKEAISILLLGQNDFLGQSLSGMSVDVLTQWVYASISIKCYVMSQEEEERLNARERLLNIREMLCIDDLFEKRKPFMAQERLDSMNDSEGLNKITGKDTA